MRCATRDDRLLACELAAAIRAARVRRVGFDAGAFIVAIKYVVGRVMNDRCTQSLRFVGDDAGRNGIDFMRQLGLALGAINRGIGCRVDNELRPHCAHGFHHGIRIGQVHQFAIAAVHFAEPRQRAREFPAKLTVFAGEHDFQS